MRELFILIILPLIVIGVRCSDVDKDSYNVYKDSYAPVQGFEYLSMPIWLPEYRKRANGVKKRKMEDLVKLDDRLKKRTSKAALSLMLQSKQDPDLMEEENSCFAGK